MSYGSNEQENNKYSNNILSPNYNSTKQLHNNNIKHQTNCCFMRKDKIHKIRKFKRIGFGRHVKM